MTLSEKSVYDDLKEMKDNGQTFSNNFNLGFNLQVAYDNENWDLVKKILSLIK